jgi:hypothetical protein
MLRVVAGFQVQVALQYSEPYNATQNREITEMYISAEISDQYGHFSEKPCIDQ